MKLSVVHRAFLIAACALAVALLPARGLAAQPDKAAQAKARQRRMLERARQAWLERIERLHERERSRTKGVHEKGHEAIRRAFRPVVADANRSLVTILCDGQPALLGTVVDPDGLILTKASDLRGTVLCKPHGGKKRKTQVVGVSDPHDLAMLKIDSKGLKPIVWAEQPPVVGSLVATPGGGPDPVAIGVISVAPRPLTPRGFLGIGFQGDGDEARIGQVMPRSAAAKAGIKLGDLITRIDDKPVKSSQDVIKAISGHSPGDKLALHIRRGNDERTLNATLGSRRRLSPQRQRRLDLMNRLGGPLSDRRSDFASALQHDTVLLPSQCGGPLVDLDGKAVGINVARAGRVESYAIPAAAVRPLIVQLKAGKLAPGPKFLLDMKLKAIDHRLAHHGRVLRQARRDKADAERRIKLATAALAKAKAERAKIQPKPPQPKPPQPKPRKPAPPPRPDAPHPPKPPGDHTPPAKDPNPPAKSKP